MDEYLSIGYITHKRFQKAIDLFGEIENPKEIMNVLFFNACAQVQTGEALALVKTVSDRMPSSFFTNAHITTSLVDALMKCGDVATAEKIFRRSKIKNQITSAAMMKGK